MIVVLLPLMFAQPLKAPSFTPSWEVHVLPAAIDGPVNTTQETPQYWAAYGFSLTAIVSNLWQVRNNRIFAPSDIDSMSMYDFVLVPPRQLDEGEKITTIRKSVEKHFRMRVIQAKRSMNVYVLSAPHGKSSALREDQTSEGQIVGSGLGGTDRELSGTNVRMSDVCETIERFKNALVVDETNLQGYYSFHVKGNGDFEVMLKEQLGLVLTSGQRDVDVLLIQRN